MVAVAERTVVCRHRLVAALLAAILAQRETTAPRGGLSVEAAGLDTLAGVADLRGEHVQADINRQAADLIRSACAALAEVRTLVPEVVRVRAALLRLHPEPDAAPGCNRCWWDEYACDHCGRAGVA